MGTLDGYREVRPLVDRSGARGWADDATVPTSVQQQCKDGAAITDETYPDAWPACTQCLS